MARFTAAPLGVALLFGLLALPSADASTEIDELLAQLGTRHWDEAVDRLAEIGPPAIEPLTGLTGQAGHIGGRACEALARIGTPPALAVVRPSTWPCTSSV